MKAVYRTSPESTSGSWRGGATVGCGVPSDPEPDPPFAGRAVPLPGVVLLAGAPVADAGALVVGAALPVPLVAGADPAVEVAAAAPAVRAGPGAVREGVVEAAGLGLSAFAFDLAFGLSAFFAALPLPFFAAPFLVAAVAVALFAVPFLAGAAFGVAPATRALIPFAAAALPEAVLADEPLVAAALVAVALVADALVAAFAPVDLVAVAFASGTLAALACARVVFFAAAPVAVVRREAEPAAAFAPLVAFAPVALPEAVLADEALTVVAFVAVAFAGAALAGVVARALAASLSDVTAVSSALDAAEIAVSAPVSVFADEAA